MRKILYYLLPVSLLLSLAKCASESQLTGGPKDTQPPVLIEAIPAQKSTHFVPQTVNLYFNEYIKLNNVAGELVISPPMETKPEISVRGKRLHINISGPLLPNTTYTLYFGKALADITENNAIPNFKYVFSTGDFVDSLSIGGKVTDALEGSPEENILAMLYRLQANDTLPPDSLPLLRKPTYLSRTGKNGEYHIDNIAQGQYLLFGLKDDNRNYRYDLPSEEIAFADSLINLHYPASGDSMNLATPGIDLYLFQERDSIQRLQSAKLKEENHILIVYKLPLNAPHLKLLENNDTIVYFYRTNATKDSLDFWFSPVKSDSLSLLITDKSVGVDSLKIKIIPAGKQLGKKLFVSSNLQKNGLRPDTNLILAFNYPVVRFDTSKISLFQDSIPLPCSLQWIDSAKTRLSVSAKIQEGMPYKIIMTAGTFTDIRQKENDSSGFVFKKKTEEDYGSISLQIKHQYHFPKIIQLLNKKGKSIRQKIVQNDTLVSFKLLPAGEYKLRCIIDKNANGHWDPGNYHLHRQAEKVLHFSKTIKVRASWEIQEKWAL